jgi:hypothetical protein
VLATAGRVAARRDQRSVERAVRGTRTCARAFVRCGGGVRAVYAEMKHLRVRGRAGDRMHRAYICAIAIAWSAAAAAAAAAAIPAGKAARGAPSDTCGSGRGRLAVPRTAGECRLRSPRRWHRCAGSARPRGRASGPTGRAPGCGSQAPGCRAADWNGGAARHGSGKKTATADVWTDDGQKGENSMRCGGQESRGISGFASKSYGPGRNGREQFSACSKL